MLKDLVTFYTNGEDWKSNRAIIHCRGGHGRTGTLILILTRLLQKIFGTYEQISQSNTLVLLRGQRSGLCEEEEQYIFARNMIDFFDISHN